MSPVTPVRDLTSLTPKHIPSSVSETFVEKEMTEEDALVNARLARILTTDDYDHDKREPILWQPLGQYEINPPPRSGDEGDSTSSV